MSPESSKEIKKSSIDQSSEALREHYLVIEMEPGEIHEIDPLDSKPDKKLVMAECGNDSLRTYQTLRAVIKAGQEMFFVIDTMTLIKPKETDQDEAPRPRFVNDTVLARRNPNGERAELVSFVSTGDRPLRVGRKYQHGLSPQTSGDHFSIARVADGSIGLVDNGSTNGTELFKPRQATIGEKYGFSSELTQATAHLTDPLQEHEFWSMDSATLKDYVEFIHSGNQEVKENESK